MSRPTTPDLLTPWLGARLQPHGFRRDGKTWRRPGEGVVSVVNLQASVYGGQRYLNLGVWLLALGERARPQERHCHLRLRWDSLLADDDARLLEEALDLEADIDAEDRVQMLDGFAKDTLDVFVAGTRTLDEVRQLHRRGFFESGLIHVGARHLLQGRLSEWPTSPVGGFGGGEGGDGPV